MRRRGVQKIRLQSSKYTAHKKTGMMASRNSYLYKIQEETLIFIKYKRA